MDKVKLAYVIDDDEVIRFLTEQMFRQMDCCERTEFFTQPGMALEALRKSFKLQKDVPDFILLDLKMPEMDGWGFLE